jgi:2-polyprenyl-3-methyl-5-hydroxy-6-metoxy-1,4-benzoquinol methylase
MRQSDNFLDNHRLEVGVGTGRIARKVLSLGCQEFTGIDISPRTVNRAKGNLAKYSNAELLVADVQEYSRSSYYDIAYSVLTFMHVENKEIAITNMVDSVRVGGHIVLSISEQNVWLNYGDRKVRLFLRDVNEYANQFKKLGCHVEEQIEILDGLHWSESYGQKTATLFKATKQRQD